MCHYGKVPEADDYTGRSPIRYTGWVQAGTGLQGQRLRPWVVHTDDSSGRQAVKTFIDYNAAFDTESQMFLDEALAEAGVGAKVRRIVQAIFAAANRVVRLRHPDGTMTLSEPFDFARGVLQGGHLPEYDHHVKV